MPQLNIGIQLASLRQPLKKALHTAARLGAQGVEIDARDEVFSQDLSHSAVRHLRKGRGRKGSLRTGVLTPVTGASPQPGPQETKGEPLIRLRGTCASLVVSSRHG